MGNGRYGNPVLNADYPDVDIERSGDKYYMITSTVAYVPGMTILESSDLVNWELMGHIFSKLDWDPRYNWDQMDGYGHGVWAGDLAQHDGRWFCYFIDPLNGLYVSYTDNIGGLWEDPKLMLAKKRWTDPAVFWEEKDHTAYLICNYGKEHGVDQNGDGNTDNEISLFKMSWDGLSLLDSWWSYKTLSIYWGFRFCIGL